MYRFDIIAVGKLPEDFVTSGCREFIKRLSPYAAVNVVTLPHSRLNSETPSDITAAIEDEQERILACLPKGAVVVAMCIEGREYTTEQLCDYLSECSLSGRSRIAFVIGGSHGLGERIKRTADLSLSMSRMTFTHGFARLMLLEQLYRAISIQNNLKYHK